MERCHAWIRSSFDELVKHFQVNLSTLAQGDCNRPLKVTLRLQAHVLGQQFGSDASPYHCTPTSSLVANATRALVSKNDPSIWPIVGFIQGCSGFISEQNVLRWQFYVFWPIVISFAVFGIHWRPFHEWDVFLIPRRTFLLVNFGIFFNPAASNIFPLLFPKWHSLLEEFCVGFHQF